MFEEVLLPDSSCLRLEGYDLDGNTLVFSLTTTEQEAICPYCQTPSQRQNGCYGRKPADLPCFGYQVRLDLTVRRFFCENDACKYVTFAQRLPTVVAPYARRTNRLAKTQQGVAFEAGGELGARLLALVRMNISADTVLRLIRRAAETVIATPRVLGVDDWALCKGQRYGTILVDLEMHQVVDLLPDSSAQLLAAWLRDHPGVEIISRDRGIEYIKGATEGAPDAIQVADRWHLLQNLKDALLRLLNRKIACLRAIAKPAGEMAATEVDDADTDSAPANTKLTVAEKAKQERRAKRQARYDKVRLWHELGISKRQIAHQLGLSRKTVSKYISADTCPMYPEGRVHRSKLDPFLPYLQQRWDEGCRNASLLWREIVDREFSGSRTTVATWVARQRKLLRSNPGQMVSQQPSNRRPLTPNRAVWLFLKSQDSLSLNEQETLQRLVESDGQLAQAYTLAQGFCRIVRERRATQLVSWLAAIDRCDIDTLKRFAHGLRQDLDAVLAALTLPWSNGQTEGQINRLKLIKRQMYGRANFDLLRMRVLPRPELAPG